MLPLQVQSLAEWLGVWFARALQQVDSFGAADGRAIGSGGTSNSGGMANLGGTRVDWNMARMSLIRAR
jgi:hypothetical protein